MDRQRGLERGRTTPLMQFRRFSSWVTSCGRRWPWDAAREDRAQSSEASVQPDPQVILGKNPHFLH